MSRAMVRKIDERSAALAAQGAEVVVGDLFDINSIRSALEGVEAAYFVYPIAPGLITAAVNFAQAAKEAGTKTVLNLSQRSANRNSTRGPLVFRAITYGRNCGRFQRWMPFSGTHSTTC
jgi:uncharacterized protein YbjT (DUF2867 family)